MPKNSTGAGGSKSLIHFFSACSRKTITVLGVSISMALASALLNAPDAGAQSLPSEQQTILFQGMERTFQVYSPPTVDRTKPSPLVFLFHGGGGSGSQAEFTYKMDECARSKKFIVVYPDGLHKQWNDGRPTANPRIDDVGFVQAIIDTLKTQMKIDERFIFSSGMSNGAMFSHHLGLHLSQSIKAIGTVAGEITVGDENVKPTKPVSVLSIHGTDDELVPINGGFVVSPKGGRVTSQNDTFKKWQSYNGGASGSAKISVIPPTKYSLQGTTFVPIQTPATVTTVKTKSGSTCTRVTVQNAGHTWAGHVTPGLTGKDGITAINFDATEMISQFFMDIVNGK
jgi:Poly(3-hydroxybutyrate) depolymerase